MAIIDVHIGHRLGCGVVRDYRIRIVMRFVREVLAAVVFLIGVSALYIGAYWLIWPWR